MTYATDALHDQMLKGAGNARFWLDQVKQGFVPHLDGVDNTVAFVAHYEKQLAMAENFLRTHA
jgi:hypothetical protein